MMIKSIMRWSEHVVHMHTIENIQKIAVGSLTAHMEDLGINGNRILKWILGKECWKIHILQHWIHLAQDGD
jgi:hypothetical protein